LALFSVAKKHGNAKNPLYLLVKEQFTPILPILKLALFSIFYSLPHPLHLAFARKQRGKQWM